MDRPNRPVQSAPLTYLVTGGTGFIGAALCNRLLADGHAVFILTRQYKKLTTQGRTGVTYIHHLADLNPGVAFDVVINLAGEPVVGARWSASRRAALQASRRDLTHELVRWMQSVNTRPRLMISASAIGYYGVQDENDMSMLAEDAPAQSIFMSELCQEWEAAALAAKSLGVSVAIIRLGVVLADVGEHKGALPPMVLPLRFGLSGKIGTGRQAISWVHRDDVLAAIEFLQTLPTGQVDGIYNLCAPQPCTQVDFIKAVAHGMQSRVLLPLSAPAWVLRLVLGEQASLLLQGQRVIPRRLIDLGYQFHFATLDAALEDCLRYH
jgi:uncharacterized protein (TIGR01777 family)